MLALGELIVYPLLLWKPVEESYLSKSIICVKGRLISIFAQTETQKTQKLLTEVTLGDGKSSQLLCEMKNLTSDKVVEAFRKTF